MNKSIVSVALSLIVSLILATGAFAKAGDKAKQTPKQKTPARTSASAKRGHITIEVWGAESPEAAAALNKAFADNGLRVAIQESNGKPVRMLAEMQVSQDLAKLGQAVASVDSPQKSQTPPGLNVVIFAPLTKE